MKINPECPEFGEEKQILVLQRRTQCLFQNIVGGCSFHISAVES